MRGEGSPPTPPQAHLFFLFPPYKTTQTSFSLWGIRQRAREREMTQVFCNLSHSKLQFGGREGGIQNSRPNPSLYNRDPPSPPLRRGKGEISAVDWQLGRGRRAGGCYSAGRNPQIGKNYSSVEKAPVLAGRHRGRCCRGGRLLGMAAPGAPAQSPAARLRSPGCRPEREVMLGKRSWSGKAGQSRFPCGKGTWHGLHLDLVKGIGNLRCPN